MTSETLGVFILVVSIFMMSSKGVYLSFLMQKVDANALMVGCFITVIVFFGALQIFWGKNLRKLWRPYVRDILFLNLTTAGNWIGFFYTLKYLQPAVAISISNAIGPLLTVIMAQKLRPGSKTYGMEIFASIGVIFSMIFIVWGLCQGRSGVGDQPGWIVALGVSTALLCGTCAIVNLLYNKRLTDAGFRPQDIMSVRFFFLILLVFIMAPNAISTGLRQPEFLTTVITVAFAGMIIPIYLFLLGVERCEPMMIALLMLLEPVFMFALEFFDPRLHFSWMSLTGVVLTIVFSMLGIWGRYRKLPFPLFKGSPQTAIEE